jgi:hypothetical protein
MSDHRRLRASGRRAAEVVAATTTPTRNRSQRWQRIGDFLAVWDRPLSKRDGCSVLEVERAQQHLGHPLPVSLTELYRLLGHRTEMLSHQNHHLLPIMRLETAGHMLRFACEWQANWWWRVRLDDILVVDDPAVYVDNLLTKETASGRADGEALYPTSIERLVPRGEW